MITARDLNPNQTEPTREAPETALYHRTTALMAASIAADCEAQNTRPADYLHFRGVANRLLDEMDRAEDAEEMGLGLFALAALSLQMIRKVQEEAQSLAREELRAALTTPPTAPLAGL